MDIRAELNINPSTGKPIIRFKLHSLVCNLEQNLLRVFIEEGMENGIKLEEATKSKDSTYFNIEIKGWMDNEDELNE